MSDVTAIAALATDLKQTQLRSQVQVSVLKESLDSEKDAAKMLLELLGVGGKIDVTA